MRCAVRAVIVAAFLGCLALPVSAAPVTIDFESFADLETLDTQIPGLTFTNALVLQAGSVGGTLNEIDFPPVSGFNVIIDDSGPITIAFAAPVSNVSLFLTHSGVTLTALDAGANSLGVVSSPVANFGSNELLGFAVANISKLIIAGALLGGSFALDDLAFETQDVQPPVPEPATLVLTALALASFALWRRKDARTRA